MRYFVRKEEDLDIGAEAADINAGIFTDKDISYGALIIYIYIAQFAQGYNFQKKLAANHLNISERVLTERMRELSKKDYILIDKDQGYEKLYVSVGDIPASAVKASWTEKEEART